MRCSASPCAGAGSSERGLELVQARREHAGPAEVPDLQLDRLTDNAVRRQPEAGPVLVEAETDQCPRPRGRGSVSVAGWSSTSPDGSSFRPIGTAPNGEPCSERSGVAVIIVPSGTAPAGIARLFRSTAIVPPSAPIGSVVAAASSATAATCPSNRTLSPIRPTWPPGSRASTTTSPNAARGGTRKLARLPVVESTPQKHRRP